MSERAVSKGAASDTSAQGSRQIPHQSCQPGAPEISPTQLIILEIIF